MKKSYFCIFLSLLLTVLLSNSITFAQRISTKGPNLQLFMNCVEFDSSVKNSVTFENGLTVTFNDVTLSSTPADYNMKTSGYDYYWFTEASLQKYIGVRSINITFTNSSSDVLVVKWSESSYNIGSYSGPVLLEGVKLIDAGKPSSLPDTIVPLGESISKAVFIGKAEFIRSGAARWELELAPLSISTPPAPKLYLKVLANDGASKYYSAIGPKIMPIEFAKTYYIPDSK